MEDNAPLNPHLSDIFKTALAAATNTNANPPAPSVVIHGHHNVLAWGGIVYLDTTQTSSRKE
jgi:hypothetical protein